MELRRIAPQLRFHSISVALEKNREKRVITLTDTNWPKNLPSHVSNNMTGRSYADTLDEQKSPET